MNQLKMNQLKKIDPACLAFDIDGVVADIMTLFIDIARTRFGIDDIAYNDITRYNLEECLSIDDEIIGMVIDDILTGNHAALLKPVSGAGEVLSRINQQQSPILFVTARPSPGLLLSWMEDELLLPAPCARIVATGSFEAKADELKQRDISVFVDDRLETCFDLAQAGITPILFKQPWNREKHPFMEVGSWQELESLVEFK